jgi:hypothetical protein
MLDLAYNHIEEVETKFRETLLKERYKYYQRGSGLDYHLSIADNSHTILQFVSMDPSTKKVIGYLGAKLNRDTNSAYELEAINFLPQANKFFTEDLGTFIVMLFTRFGLNRIVWSVIIGNPVEQMYDRVTKFFGNCVVGVLHDEVKLYDGQLYDVKYYELMREEFLAAYDEKNLNIYNYRKRGEEK